MIIHGILSVHGTFDNFIDEMNEITKNDIKREPKQLNWEKTKVFDNSNRGRMVCLEGWR